MKRGLVILIALSAVLLSALALLTLSPSSAAANAFSFPQQVDKDWGDLPDSFDTLSASSGPSHVITSDLYLGSCVDAETDGQPDSYAGIAGTVSNGDDGSAGYPVAGTCANGDDEDGITTQSPFSFVLPTSPCINVTAHNATGADANLYGWIDFNGDGAFDSTEALTGGAGGVGNFSGGKAIVPAGGVIDGPYCFAAPPNATFKNGDGTYMRFRLTSDTLNGNAPWGGAASNGEVEDYRFAYDMGDLPRDYNLHGYSPSHIISPDLYFGSCVDAEWNDLYGAGAINDDNNMGNPVAGTCVDDDDEDGIALTTPLIPGQQACFNVTAHNAKASPANIYAFIDWNGNESFSDFGFGDYEPYEAFTLGSIPAQTDWIDNSLCTTVPILHPAVEYKNKTVCMRFRLTTDSLSEYELERMANDGEVEDYCLEFGPNVVSLSGITADAGSILWLPGLAVVAMAGLAAFIWRRQRAL